LVFEWFLELDFATSTLNTLARKLDRYAHLAAATRPRPILIWLPTRAREAHARHRLTHALQTVGAGLVPVATSTAALAALPRPDLAHRSSRAAGMAPGPADRVWLPLTAQRGIGRIGLAELARIWPASPGHTVVDEADTPAGTELDLDLEPGDTRLPPPNPLPPIPAPRSTREHP